MGGYGIRTVTRPKLWGLRKEEQLQQLQMYGQQLSEEFKVAHNDMELVRKEYFKGASLHAALSGQDKIWTRLKWERISTLAGAIAITALLGAPAAIVGALDPIVGNVVGFITGFNTQGSGAMDFAIGVGIYTTVLTAASAVSHYIRRKVLKWRFRGQKVRLGDGPASYVKDGVDGA